MKRRSLRIRIEAAWFGILVLATAGVTVEAKNAKAPAGKPPSMIKAASAPGAMALDGDTLLYCDRRGARILNLRSAADSAGTVACPAQGEADSACSATGMDVDVRSPPGRPDDIVDAGGKSFAVKGRVVDCASDGASLAVATASGVSLLDTVSGKSRVVDRGGGDRLGIGPNWIVWSTGATVKWLPRPAAR